MPVIAIIAIVAIVIILNKTGVSDSLAALTLATVAALLTGGGAAGAASVALTPFAGVPVCRCAGGYFCGDLCLCQSGSSDFRKKIMKRKTLPLLALVATTLFLSACDDRSDELKTISKFKDLTPPRFSDVVSRQDDVSEEWSQVGFSSGLTLQVLRTRQSPDGCEGGSYYYLVDMQEKTVQPLMNALCIADNIKLEYHEVTDRYTKEKYFEYSHDGKLMGRLLIPSNPENHE